MALTAILDIDGTLVDTNYHHAIAWHRALHAHGHSVQVWRIHRHIGMGGDKIVAALAGAEAEESEGDEIREAEAEAYGELIGEVEPMQGARDLIAELRADGTTVILASSAKQGEVDHYLDLGRESGCRGRDPDPRRPHRRLLGGRAARGRRRPGGRVDRGAAARPRDPHPDLTGLGGGASETPIGGHVYGPWP